MNTVISEGTLRQQDHYIDALGDPRQTGGREAPGFSRTKAARDTERLNGRGIHLKTGRSHDMSPRPEEEFLAGKSMVFHSGDDSLTGTPVPHTEACILSSKRVASDPDEDIIRSGHSIHL